MSTETPVEPRGRRRLAVVAVAGAALLLSPILAFRATTDQGVFLYMGSRLLHGGWPYLATWAVDYPGLVFLQAFELLLLGKSIVAFRLFDWLLQVGSASFIFLLTRRVAGAAGALLAACVFALLYQHQGPWNTAQRESFGLFFALAGLTLVVFRGAQAPRSSAFLAGLTIGFCFLIKPTLLSFAALYAPLVLRVRRAGPRRALGIAAAAALGVALPTALTLALYARLGGLAELWEACIHFPVLYAELSNSGGSFWAEALHKTSRLSASSLFILGLAALLPLARRRRLELGMLACGYLGTLFAVWVQGTFAGYHYQPALGLGCILLGTAFSRSVELARRLAKAHIPGLPFPPARLLALLAVLLAIPFYVRPGDVRDLVSGRFLKPPGPQAYHNLPVFNFYDSWNAAAYMREHTRPSDRIQVWGYESLTYFLADRRAASRFQTTTPLVLELPGKGRDPLQDRWRAEFVADIQRTQPPYVAVVRDGGWWWAPGHRSSDLLIADFPEWRQILEERYRLEAEIGRFLVYRRRGPTDEEAGHRQGGRDLDPAR